MVDSSASRSREKCKLKLINCGVTHVDIGLIIPTSPISSSEVQKLTTLSGDMLQSMDAKESNTVVSKARSRPIPGPSCCGARPEALIKFFASKNKIEFEL